MEKARIFRKAFYGRESQEKGARPQAYQEAAKNSEQQVLLRFSEGVTPSKKIGVPTGTLFLLLVLSLFLFAQSCTNNPPSIINVHAAIESSYTPSNNTTRIRQLVLVRSSDPDGSKDVSHVVIEHIESKLFWYFTADQLLITPDKDSFTIVLRNLSNPSGVYGHSLVIVQDRGGNQATQDFELPKPVKGSFPIPLLKKQDKGFVLEALSTVNVSMQGLDGKAVLNADIVPGFHAWTEFSIPGGDPAKISMILQAYSREETEYTRSGPW